ncbi:hypothetical protein JZX86_27685 [Agrobacterium rosae]|uniref:hypothetical protein n=1 Tax=Agrobacterium rosae TaxID=1972867 RepID=UPI0019D35F2D|nr:hypothetical protein [Agrobacterium rosae]MBN7809105.1 hypothetical protein [Agrobacterium rosae]
MTHEEKLLIQAARNIRSQSDWKILLDGMEKQLFSIWSASNVNDTQVREDNYKIMRGLRFANDFIEKVANTPDFEQKRDDSIPEA